ncbi:MAG TPA: carboxypeptidase-like regulatory domain-containing protein, partial [Vicinamibacterales bacterium]|nr:carboxypeptidase-like regulatory domain-containing protein [Vicinamibacterales bacterium]
MFRLAGVTLRALGITALAVAIPALATAQMTRGSIVGTVRDASGGVIPGVTVTVTNVATNTVRVAVTDEQGLYRVQALEPGTYSITTELDGFAKVEQRDIRVQPAQDTSVDITLRPAGMQEAVTVTAEAAHVGLNRTNPTIGTTISSRAVEELP